MALAVRGAEGHEGVRNSFGLILSSFLSFLYLTSRTSLPPPFPLAPVCRICPGGREGSGGEGGQTLGREILNTYTAFLLPPQLPSYLPPPPCPSFLPLALPNFLGQRKLPCILEVWIVLLSVHLVYVYPATLPLPLDALIIPALRISIDAHSYSGKFRFIR